MAGDGRRQQSCSLLVTLRWNEHICARYDSGSSRTSRFLAAKEPRIEPSPDFSHDGFWKPLKRERTNKHEMASLRRSTRLHYRVLMKTSESNMRIKTIPFLMVTFGQNLSASVERLSVDTGWDWQGSETTRICYGTDKGQTRVWQTGTRDTLTRKGLARTGRGRKGLAGDTGTGLCGDRAGRPCLRFFKMRQSWQKHSTSIKKQCKQVWTFLDVLIFGNKFYIFITATSLVFSHVLQG